MSHLFERHESTLRAAVDALSTRGYWSAYPEIPSAKFYGETARQEGQAAYDALLGQAFALPGHPESSRVGTEQSPFGGALGICYPTARAEELLVASQTAAPAWRDTSIQKRIGICMEVIARLNQRSFQMAHAVTNTTGQAFPMAFQAGGPHAQDRALEAVASSWIEMNRIPAQAEWRKATGRDQFVTLDKHWRIVPRGVALCIGCQTFPTWNSYPDMFASLATGNTVIAKPHPGAILPMALTVSVAREVLAEQGLPADVVLLAAEDPGGSLARELALDERVAIIDFTGSSAFGQWLRKHAATPLVYTEETGVNSVVIASCQDFDGMCENLAFSLALYSGQMCTTPQNLFIPRSGIETAQGHRTFDEVTQGVATAIDRLLADPTRAMMVAGAIGNPETLARIDNVRGKGGLSGIRSHCRGRELHALPRRCFWHLNPGTKGHMGRSASVLSALLCRSMMQKRGFAVPARWLHVMVRSRQRCTTRMRYASLRPSRPLPLLGSICPSIFWAASTSTRVQLSVTFTSRGPIRQVTPHSPMQPLS